MRPVRILFEVFYLYHLPQFAPFFHLIADDPRFDIRFTTAGRSDEEIRLAREAFEALGKPGIFGEDEEARYRLIDEWDPDFMIVGWGRKGYIDHVKDRPRPAIIMIYHGIGVKASYYRDANPRVDYRVVESPYREEQLREHQNTSKLLPTGFIKLDPLYRGVVPESDDLRRELDLDPNRKTVLYAPTFYPTGLTVLREEIARATVDHNLVIKPHDYTWLDPLYREDRALLESIARDFEHVRLVPPRHFNIIPFLFLADLLVTDASSVLFEFLPLDRPIIVCSRYVRRPELEPRRRWFQLPWRSGRLDLKTYRHRDFFDEIEKPAQLASCVESNLADPGRLSMARQETAKKMLHYTDGQSANRLLAHFEGMLKEYEPFLDRSHALDVDD